MSYGSLQQQDSKGSLSNLVHKWEEIEIREFDPHMGKGEEEFWEEWEEMTSRRWVPCSNILGYIVWMADFGLFQFFILAGVLCLGGLFFQMIENEQSLDYVQSVYWGAVTVATIGYGDVVPKTPSGKIYTVFFSIFVIPYYFFVSSILWTSLAIFAHWSMKKLLGIPTKQKILSNFPTWKQNLVHFAPAILAVLCFFVSIFCGAVIFSTIEGWNYWEGVYFCFITQATIGYGDSAVETRAGQIILIFYSFWSITTMGALITSFQTVLRTKRHQRSRYIKQELSRQLKTLVDQLEEESKEEFN